MLIPARIDEEFRKAWLPYFCRSGQREASLEEFNEEVEGVPLLLAFALPRLTGQMLVVVKWLYYSKRIITDKSADLGEFFFDFRR